MRTPTRGPDKVVFPWSFLCCWKVAEGIPRIKVRLKTTAQYQLSKIALMLQIQSNRNTITSLFNLDFYEMGPEVSLGLPRGLSLPPGPGDHDSHWVLRFPKKMQKY